MELKEKSKYALKNGVLFHVKDRYGDNIDVSNDNITDKLAEKYLKEKPEKIIFFAKYPDDWCDRIGRAETKKNWKGIKIPFDKKWIKNTVLVITIVIVTFFLMWLIPKIINIPENKQWVVGVVSIIIGIILTIFKPNKNK